MLKMQSLEKRRSFILIQLMKPDFVFKDTRGNLAQLVHNGFKQVNYIFSVGGSFRGGHYHKENTECFYVIKGKFEIALKLDGQEKSYTFQTGDMFCVFPMAVHRFFYLEDTQLIAMYDKGIERSDGTKDIYIAEE